MPSQLQVLDSLGPATHQRARLAVERMPFLHSHIYGTSHTYQVWRSLSSSLYLGLEGEGQSLNLEWGLGLSTLTTSSLGLRF